VKDCTRYIDWVTIGKIAIIDEHPFPATLNTGVFVVRPIEKKYLPLLLYYVLNSNYFLKFINRFKGGSTINHLYQKDFVKFTFPIPSLPEQQKIATILSNIDDKITSQVQYKEKLEKLKKSLMQKLLTGEVRV
jgi:type I restriction enzyme S subunit